MNKQNKKKSRTNKSYSHKHNRKRNGTSPRKSPSKKKIIFDANWPNWDAQPTQSVSPVKYARAPISCKTSTNNSAPLSQVQSSPPQNYVCKICNIPGHWIQNCPNRKSACKQPPDDYVCHKCAQKGHWIKDCTLKHSIPPSDYVCMICNIPGHWIQQCPNRFTMNQVETLPKFKTYHVNSDEYCDIDLRCKYCKNPNIYTNYLVTGYIKTNIKDVETPRCIMEIISLFFDTTSRFIEAWKNRNDYLMSYNRVHDDLILYFGDGKANEGMVIYENGAIHYGYNGGNTQDEFRINYKMNKYLDETTFHKLKELLNEHAKNQQPKIASGIIDCGGGYKLTQTLRFKIDNEIKSYDACTQDNKDNDLWKFLNGIHDIFSHVCDMPHSPPFRTYHNYRSYEFEMYEDPSLYWD